MSGHELREEQIGLIHRPSDVERAQWALRLARAAAAKGHSRDAIVDVLEHLGLVDPAVPLPASTDPNGMTKYPTAESRRKAADRQAAYERRNQEAS